MHRVNGTAGSYLAGAWGPFGVRLGVSHPDRPPLFSYGITSAAHE